MEDFILAQNAGMWDSDLQTLNKALIHAKDGLIRQPEQLTMEVKLQIQCVPTLWGWASLSKFAATLALTMESVKRIQPC